MLGKLNLRFNLCSFVNALSIFVSTGGLDEFIQRVSQTASDDLAVQLKIYNDLKEADFDEFQSKWHGVQSDMLDVTEIFNVSSLTALA